MNRSRITGDLTASGLLYADIANDRVGIGSTIPGNKLSLPDSAKIGLGNAEDLEIWHDGTGSQINNDTGYLVIQSDDLRLRDKASGHPYLKGVADGAVELYHNNSKKLETTDTGAVVTGILTATTFSGSGANLTNLPDKDQIKEGNSYAEILDTGTNGIFRFLPEGTEVFRIDKDGKVGIGTNNAVGNLEVRDTKANFIVAKDGLTVKGNSDLATQYDMIQLGAGGALASYSTATATADTQLVHNAYRHSGGNWKRRYQDTAMNLRMNSPANTFRFFNAATGNADADITWTERTRIDANGKLQLGSTTATGYNDFDGIGSLNLSNNSADGTVDYTQGIVFCSNASNEGTWTHAGIVATGSSGYNGNLIFATDGSGARDNAASNLTERLRIEADGDFRFSSDNAASNYGWIRGWQSATGDMIIGADQSATGTGTSKSNLIFRSRGSEKLRITSGGTLNVPAGIGQQIRFENQHSVTTDAAISTFDDASGTLFAIGSNFYFDSSGAENRYNTGEESAGITLNRTGTINLSTGGTGATATSRLGITAGGQIGINLSADAAGGLVQIRNNMEYTNGTTNLLTSASKAAFRIRTSSNSSKSLYFGGIDESATPYLQVGNLSTGSGGATAVYPIVLQPYGGTVNIGGNEGGYKTTIIEETSNTTTASTQLLLYAKHDGSGNTGVGFGGGIRFWGDRNGDNAEQNMGRIMCIADVNSGTNLSGALVFETAAAGTNAERLRINSSGKVKIGSGDPSLALLHIAPADYSLNLQNNSSNESKIIFTKNGTPNDARAWIKANGEINGYLKFGAGDADRLTITSDGQLAIASSTNKTDIHSSFKSIQVYNHSYIWGYTSASYPAVHITNNARPTTSSFTSGWKRDVAGTYTAPVQLEMYHGNFNIRTADNDAADSAISWDTRFTVKQNGNVLIGTTTDSSNKLTLYGTNTSVVMQNSNTGTGSGNGFYVGNGANTICYVWNYENEAIRWATNDTEYMRLNKHGWLKIKGNRSSYIADDSDNYHEMLSDNPHNVTLYMRHDSSNGYGIIATFNHAKSTHYAYRVHDFSTSTDRCYIRTDGDLENTNNTYTNTSDVKLKENIVDANSQWDDIKALRVRNFNFKASTGLDTHKQLGLVAQEVEAVCPGLVKSRPDLGPDNTDLGTETKVLKSSILYMKAIKALQEAQTRIETLEAKVAALEGS